MAHCIRHRTRLVGALLVAVASTAAAQNPAPSAPRRGADVPLDSARVRLLYVSNRPADLPKADYDRQIAQKRATDSIYAARSAGLMEFRKITYKSRADGMEIPAYLFAPLAKRGTGGHAAMVWVHGGVHGDWGTSMFPFVREAVQRGYVVVTPDYRGSTGHGAAHYEAIDYGGKEVDDVISAVDYLKTLPYVDMNRLGIMGWSHGGFITAHTLYRTEHPFKAGAAIVPVTNLVFRLSYKGPGYQRDYAAEEGIGGLPFEKREEYIKRSPVFHVENLKVPILVHVATNDEDVNFVEDQQMVYTLRALKPDLAETKIYVNPAPWGSSVGHAFSRRVDPKTLERVDSPEQIDSWNRTWTFFEWNLRPYEDRSKPLPPVRTMP
ncbi:putative S9C family peptidase [Gemmatirosa kalamazoonensis]|uniref:Putative S9C family peptidase n=1 Tax=Gemmatirosa kalamazoonensis TaxID=861299 RepID=W0RF01_9BACT|nr:alpha/beta fold hydrolase [Gemmatirosa kalamazoonensis]AHG89366.1 putative S9C family peptidase [Gemmatirosa kalamazoonensis]